ncbi:HNH endonuclease [Cellulosilyticum ruminicola]|uniref:HNH endonuclease n=1 Tax=Cellulosilyticum ruminicola TaxID=425254 RepID=UPI0012EDE5E9|nr:hypothetical protein [Cellulosilyticum ruminicola]
MEQINTDQLKKAFHQEMINLCKRRNQELKYKSTRLLDFINKYGGYEAAVKYITTESNVQDFTILWENERLDLSVEALITKPQYTSLFLEDIVTYCDQKLKQYSYAPNKVEEAEEKDDDFEKMLDDIFSDMDSEASQEIAKIKAEVKPYTLYNKDLGITKEEWKEIFVKINVFSAKNQDLVLRVHLMGSGIEAADLASEEGYTATYPFKEVVLALAKRIKANLKIDAPVGNDGKIIWWHMLFIGGFKDNTCFEWTVRPELSAAIDELVAEGKVSLDGITVKAHKETELPEVTKEEKVVENKTLMGRPVKPKRSVPQTLDELVDALLGDVVNNSEPVKETPAKVEIEPVVTNEMPKVENIKVQEEPQVMVQLLVAQESTKVGKEDKIAEEIAKSLAHLKEEQEAQKPLKADEIAYNKAKAACIEYYGAICDLCGFDYGYTYGEAFENQIEVHNVHSQDEVEVMENTDPIKDLIPVCHNCHGVIHSQKPPILIEKMRQMIKA